jgi:hypothetical protein
MSSNKILETGDSVGNFINAVDNEQKRKDSWYMIAMMKRLWLMYSISRLVSPGNLMEFRAKAGAGVV